MSAVEDPLVALLVPWLVGRVSEAGSRAADSAGRSTQSPTGMPAGQPIGGDEAAEALAALAQVPRWGWLLGVVTSALGLDLLGARCERDGLALLARALADALAERGQGLPELDEGHPKTEFWPRLVPECSPDESRPVGGAHRKAAGETWRVAWAVGRVLLWTARPLPVRGAGRPAALLVERLRWERRDSELVLFGPAGDALASAALARDLALGAPRASFVHARRASRFELGLPAVSFAEAAAC